MNLFLARLTLSLRDDGSLRAECEGDSECLTIRDLRDGDALLLELKVNQVTVGSARISLQLKGAEEYGLPVIMNGAKRRTRLRRFLNRVASLFE